ncbi:type VII secretion EssA family protein [Streptococcus marimammalium]|uniref:type VII secretion EssA family protein n=1 Tax=Streptococcus marimammalium TaxID=269666 RepID=UPI00035D20C2|nr:type VII secretion EssA family protein [Streptococcus marimammalium]
MKKRILIIVMTVGISIFIPTVLADDGSLKINTDIQSNETRKEVFYIEQENELSQLFKEEITKNIAQKQESSLSQERELKETIFLQEIEEENLVDNYQPLLFTTNTANSSLGEYNVTLGQKKSSISIQTVAIFLLGFLVMLFSLYRVFGHKRGKNHG